jgi:hypothetical protein
VLVRGVFAAHAAGMAASTSPVGFDLGDGPGYRICPLLCSRCWVDAKPAQLVVNLGFAHRHETGNGPFAVFGVFLSHGFALSFLGNRP